MAFTGSFMCTSFKVELMKAVHDFTAAADAFKIALYDSTATLDAATTVYTATGELATAGGYTRDTKSLGTNVTPTADGTTAITDWGTDPAWTSATFTARGALIYNSSKTNKAVAVLDFGADKPVSSGTFTIVLPAAAAATAILRLA